MYVDTELCIIIKVKFRVVVSNNPIEHYSKYRTGSKRVLSQSILAGKQNGDTHCDFSFPLNSCSGGCPSKNERQYSTKEE